MRKKIIGSIIAAIILLILGSIVLQNWEELRKYEFQFDWRYLVTSFALFVLVFFMAGVGWGLILKELGVRWSMGEIQRVWFYSQATRWIPGNVWSVVSLLYLTQGIPKSTAVLSGVLGLVINMLSGILTVLLFYAWWPTSLLADYRVIYLAVALLIFAGVFIYPKSLQLIYDNPLSRGLLRLIGREQVLNNLPRHNFARRRLFAILSFFFIYWCLSGLAFYCFILAITYLPLATLPACILIFAFSYIVSFMAFVTPSGLGVKESVTAWMLKQFVPFTIGTVIALGLRIWMICSELFCLGMVALFCKKPQLEKMYHS